MRDVSRHIRIRQSLWRFGGHPHPDRDGKPS
jgi:hypothetical protein